MSQSQTYDRSFSIMFFYLAYLKNLNDTYDHQAGDLTLKRVVSILTQ
jgi:diguanylate cyclase (GGDEF)-like protein